MAGDVLAQRLSDKYSFDLSASLWDRDRQLVLMKNTWRTEHNLKPLPLPKERYIEPAPVETTQSLLEQLISATSDDQRMQAVAALESLGLPALPAVSSQLTRLEEADPAREALEVLSHHLACVVDEIHIPMKVGPLPRQLEKTIRQVEDKSLTADSLVQILITAAQDLPEGANGIKVSAMRQGNNTGVMLKVELTDAEDPSGGFISGGGWSTHETVTLGKQSIHNASGGASISHQQDVSAYRSLAAAIEKAITSPASEPFIIRASLIEQRPQ